MVHLMTLELMQSKEKGYRRQLIRTGNMPRSREGIERGQMPWLPKKSDGLIVDVGCAWGTLLFELQQLGYTNLLGVELDEELAVEASARFSTGVGAIRIVRSDALEFFEKTDFLVDCVTMFHVLEHFPAKDGTRLLAAIKRRLHPDRGQLVIEVPNMSSITGTNMQCSDLTHATAFTEFSLRQLLDNAGFERVSVLCTPPALRLWRIGRQGSGIGWHANRWMHTLLYTVTNSGPRPNCFCPALLVMAQ
jgi:2-polyprenyl-3-methyl-5-hydroxy-6-metoxy-1,4-benzoquinol methylase